MAFAPAAATRASAMMMDERPLTPATGTAVLAAVGGALSESANPVVLAVSGGLDSMVLLDAAGRVAAGRVAAVATFDHGSGSHAADAVAVVQREAERRGLEVVVGRSTVPKRSEDAWRRARWAFFADVAQRTGGRVATAHTADDQIETVCMRILRGSGPRGLAGLFADTGVIRPLLGFRRSELARYATWACVPHLEDPTNASMAFLRNRLRRDLLPAIARVQPEFATEITELARDAARVRRTLEDIARQIVVPSDSGGVSVMLASVEGIALAGLDTLAPALAARAGVILDRRGTTRLSQFILWSRTGARIQLSGHAEALRLHDRVTIRRAVRTNGDEEHRLVDPTVAGRWRFRRTERSRPDDLWTAALPVGRLLTVRSWRAGDRMRAAGSPSARRVKRFFSDAGIVGPEREGWPVVLADGEIVWIPGVRRSDAATDRSGRPVLRYRCERNDV